MSIAQRLASSIPNGLKSAVPRPVKDIYYRHRLRSANSIGLSVGDSTWTMEIPAHVDMPWKDYPDHGCHEPLTTAAIQRGLDSDGVFWDIGSYYGYFPTAAVTLTDVDPDNVHVFEVGSLRATTVRHNLERLGCDETNLTETKLWHADGEGTLSANTYYRRTGNCPTLVKIDTDGGEAKILAGMDRVLEECRPELLVEMHYAVGPESRYQERRQGVIDALSGYGYELRITHDHRRVDGEWCDITLDELPEKKVGNSSDYMFWARP